MKKLLTLCLLLGAFACKSDDDKLMVPKIEATDTAVDAKGGEGAVGYRTPQRAKRWRRQPTPTG